MVHIFMNEHIRERVASAPVIVVQDGKRSVQTNYVEIVDDAGLVLAVIRYTPGGVKAIKSHEVKVSVEVLDRTNVRLL